MSDPSEFIVWPLADGRTMLWAIGGGLFLLAIAVAIELHRRRRERLDILDADWRAARDLLADRGIDGEDRALLLAILTQYAPDAPTRALTKRLTFDACLERYFRTLAATSDDATVAERGARLRDIRARLGLDYVPIGQRIHSTRELYTGQALWATPASGVEPRWFHLRVAAVDEASFFLAPVGADALPVLKSGERLKFRFWREDDGRYLFETPVNPTDRRPAVWRADHVHRLTRTQARAHFRIRFDSMAQVNILNAPLGDDFDGLETQTAVTTLTGRVISLSGGGLAVQFPQPVPKQILMRIPLELPGSNRALVTFVRPTGAQQLGGGQSIVRGRFIAMDEEARDNITRYVFLKQKQHLGEDRLPA